jgi:hypothetical protein
MKPNKEVFFEILINNLPKIIAFHKKGYVEIQSQLYTIPNGWNNYRSLKLNKKDFVWFLGLDIDNQLSILPLMGIVISSPVATLRKPLGDASPEAKMNYIYQLSTRRWEYQPVELNVIRHFLIFANNHSQVKSFSGIEGTAINFKEWSSAFLGWTKEVQMQFCAYLSEVYEA